MIGEIFVGILWYYQEELKDLMQYPEIRTGVLQVFKELGNAVLFCLSIEAALVRLVQISLNFNFVAICLRLKPNFVNYMLLSLVLQTLFEFATSRNEAN